MNKFVQGTDDWHAERRKHIGASDAAAIMGVSPWMTAYQLWREKRGLVPPPEETYAMRRGKDLEPVALEAFELHTGIPMIPGGVLFHKEHLVLMASMDAMSVDGSIAVEIKCPGETTHNIAKSGRVPPHYYPQLQHQMAVSGMSEMYYFSFDGMDGVTVRVRRDDEYIADMIAKELAFWGLVESGKPPELTDKDHAPRNDLEWAEAVARKRRTAALLEEAKRADDNARDALIELSEGVPSIGAGARLTLVRRVGAVDYKAIPELDGVDLEQYRKAGSESWRITIKEE